ncbi:MAG TPA: hypothetical protein H9881_19165 [Candidatus Stackebrandtia excrementipullorum]|nr:hypothetical protein [Candidatus Stackebrandtia excrementipullorum]
MKLRKYAAGAFIALATAGTIALATPAQAATATPTEVVSANVLCDTYISKANTAMEQHQYFWSIGEFTLAEQALAQYRYWMNLYNATC